MNHELLTMNYQPSPTPAPDHRYFRHDARPARVTDAGKPGFT